MLLAMLYNTSFVRVKSSAPNGWRQCLDMAHPLSSQGRRITRTLSWHGTQLLRLAICQEEYGGW